MRELDEALAKARRLVAAIGAERAELDASSASVPPDQMAQGRAAYDDALAAARRMLAALGSAARTAPDRSTDNPQPQALP